MYLTSNIPYFKCWVRKEFTNGHQGYHGEYVHALAVAVTTIPDRCLSFQVIFTALSGGIPAKLLFTNFRVSVATPLGD